MEKMCMAMTTNALILNSSTMAGHISLVGSSCRDHDSNAAKAGTVTKMANCHNNITI